MTWTKKNGQWVWAEDGKGNPNKPGDNVTPPPSFDTLGNTSTGATGPVDSKYTVEVGFGLVDANGKPLALAPIQIGSYITTLAGTNSAAYNRVKAAVSNLTGKTKLDPSYVGGYISKLATNIMASSDILARTGSLEDYFNTAAKNAPGAASSLPQSYLSSETQAKSDINTVFDKLLGREATDKEINALTVVLNDAQKKNPSKYVNGVTYGGLDKNQFLIDVITSGRYEGKPNAYPGILANLAEEASGVKAKTAATKAGKEEATLLSNKTNILKTAQANGLAMNEDDVNNYLSQVQAGKDINVVLQAIRDNGAVGMPDSVKKIVGAGVDLASVYSPYKTLLSQTLEINPNDISLNDPTLRMAIGPDKEMSLYEYQRALRKDNRWQYTNQARTEASDVARTVLKDFGFMG
jgi:hypothetical protein